MGIGNLFGFLDKLLDKLPIQGRVERIKNRLEKMELERSEILIHKADVKKAKRLESLDIAIARDRRLLKTLASD